MSTIEQFGDVNAMPLNEEIGRLKAHEERTRSAEDNKGEQLLITQSEWTSCMKKHDGDMVIDVVEDMAGEVENSPWHLARRVRAAKAEDATSQKYVASIVTCMVTTHPSVRIREAMRRLT
ncbi:hypothetical protein QQ045_029043 [Rhodiola kirilowii]